MADDAAEATNTELALLKAWIADVGMKRIDAALPQSSYEALQRELHKEPG